jgi:hypothetical protein
VRFSRLTGLPYPSLITADARSRIQLVVQSGKTLFGAHNATTWGYNGNLLGPALQLRKGKAVTVDIHNTLAEETTLHWHGLEVPGEVTAGRRASSKRAVRAASPLRPTSARDLLVPSASAWQNGPSGGDGAGGAGAD